MMDLKKIVAGFCLAVPLAQAAQFRLYSEVWTNLAGGEGGKILSLYRYDDMGNRILKESRPFPDTAGTPAGSIQYAYDSLGRPSKVVVRESGDTLSMVEYGYTTSGDLAAIKTLEKNGTLRFVDSLRYDPQGRLSENRRVVGNVILQTHRFTYDAQSRLRSDTLFERQDSVLVAAQAILNTYDSTGMPATESHFRRVDGLWYAIKTVKKGYVNRKLTFSASYERDGATAILMDSVAYDYDANGNRVEEKAFDDERLPLYSIAFQWQQIGPGSLRDAGMRGRGIQILAGSHGIKVASRNREPIRITLRNARGELIGKETLILQAGEGAYVWPSKAAAGVYLAEASQGNQRRAMAVLRP